MQDNGSAMTGPEHYAEAERILAEAKDADPDADRADVELYLEFAKVHAALAQAAATALMHGDDDTMPADWQAWNRAAGASTRLEDES